MPKPKGAPPTIGDLHDAHIIATAREKLRAATEAREEALREISRAELAQRIANEKSNGLLTLDEVAKLARVPVWRARRLREKGVIRPDKPGGGRGKLALYHFSQVEELRAAMAQIAEVELRLAEARPEIGRATRYNDRANYTTREGVEAFRLFDLGKSVAEVVQTVNLHPDAAQAVWSAWSRQARGFYLTRGHLERLFAKVGHAIAGIGDVMTSDQMVECLERHFAAGPPKCVLCKSRPRAVCKACLVEASEPPTGKRLKAPSLIDRPHVEEGDETEDREHEGDEHLKGHG